MTDFYHSDWSAIGEQEVEPAAGSGNIDDIATIEINDAISEDDMEDIATLEEPIKA